MAAKKTQMLFRGDTKTRRRKLREWFRTVYKDCVCGFLGGYESTQRDIPCPRHDSK